LLAGDTASAIHLWNAETGDSLRFDGHTQSVEDLQWSPSESTVFASSSADQYIRIWDTRKRDGSALNLHAHTSDVNVIHWNKKVGYLMVSGADDGSFSIWDLRQLQYVQSNTTTTTAAICYNH
jgi:ribosome assembly protein RRB1